MLIPTYSIFSQQSWCIPYRLAHCNITKEWCVFLASAVSSTPCHLKHLDLSENRIGDLGAGVFPDLLSNKNCNLQSLR